MSSYDEVSLRKLSYSDLKKQARKSGVKSNMKADKIIASLLEKSNDEDSFVAMERAIVNSCRKNKEELFDRERRKMSETPRRETYTVDTPLLNKQDVNGSFIMASASPDLKKQSHDETLNVTMSRGSERKSRKSTKRKVSFVTPLRRSTRLSSATPQYNSLKNRPKTPIPSRLSSLQTPASPILEKDSVACNLDLDDSETLNSEKLSGDLYESAYQHCLESSPKVILHRLKEEDFSQVFLNVTGAEIIVYEGTLTKPLTVATKLNLSNDVIESEKEDIEATPSKPSTADTKLNLSGARQKKVSVTPRQSSRKAAALTPGFKKINGTPFSSVKKTNTSTPGFKKIMCTPLPSVKKTGTPTQGFKKINGTPFSSVKKTGTPMPLIKSALTPRLTSSANKTPKSVKKATPKSAVKKTPNFNLLHQRAFEKMESLSDYHDRKVKNSLKKKSDQEKFHNPATSNSLKKKIAVIEKSKKATKVFGGIPFVPSAPLTKPVKVSLTKTKSDVKANKSQASSKKAIANNVKAIKSVSRENTPLKQKRKFDLRASLARKLPYKPHTGPLKTLNENLNNTIAATPLKCASKNKNEVVDKARAQSRDILRGVRKNKRFDLQMKNRQLNMSVQ